MSTGEVSTGEVRVGHGRTVLTASAIGSCVAIVACNRAKQQGGIAHVMLPGTAPASGLQEGWQFRYAENALDELLSQLEAQGTRADDLCFFLAGGGNVLERPDDVICRANIEATVASCRRRGLQVLAESLGGVKRRRVHLEIHHGRVCCIIGEGEETRVWTVE